MADVLNSVTTKLSVETSQVTRTINRLETGLGKLQKVMESLDTTMDKVAASMQSVSKALSSSATSMDTTAKAYKDLNKAAESYEKTSKRISKTSFKQAPNSSAWKKAMKDYDKWTTFGASTSLNKAPMGSPWAKSSGVAKTFAQQGVTAKNAFVGGLTAGLTATLARVALQMAKALAQSVIKGVDDMNQYIEKTNLFFVSLTEKYAERADTYVKRLSGSLGINDGILRELQGKLFMIGSSFGIAGDQAYHLSEQVTKLTSDFASFYNQDFTQVQDNIIAGLVGQSRAMRKYGITVNEAAIAEVARARGYNGSIRMLSEASKVQLRYIAMIEQSKRQMNDLERTIETPANMMRIFKSQTEVLSRTLGSVFMPMLQALMPVVMAFTNVVTNLLASLGKIMGFKMPDVEFAGAGFEVEEIADDSEDFADNMGSAAGSAAKIKKYFSGLDELNVMSDSSAGVGGVGSIPGYDIDFDIGDTGYEELLQQVNSMWQKLSDAIENSWFIKELVPSVARLVGALGKLLGTLLKPILDGAVRGFQAFEPLLYHISNGFNFLADGVQWLTKNVSWLNPLLETLGFILGAGGLLTVVVGLLGPLAGIVGGLGLMAGALGLVSPKVDTFTGLTAETSAKLKTFMEHADRARESLTLFELTGMISGEAHENLRTSVDGMLAEMRRLTEEEMMLALKRLDTEYALGGMTTEEYDRRKAELSSYFQDKLNTVDTYEGEINKVYAQYSDANGNLTAEGMQRMHRIVTAAEEAFVNELNVSNEQKTQALKNRLAVEENLQKETFSTILKEAKTNKENMLAEADDWKEREIALLNQKNKQTTDAEKKSYDQRVKEINAAYGKMSQNANDYYDEVYNTGIAANAELVNQVDKDTGDLTTSWDRAWKSITNFFSFGKDDIGKASKSVSTDIDKMNKDGSKSLNDMSRSTKTATDNISKYMQSVVANVNSATASFGRFNSGVAGLNTSGGRSVNVPQLARGGMPNAGSLFVAGEAGAELIGSHKGKTTVMPLENTGFVNAMYDAVKGAVISGMSAVEGSGGDVYVTMDGTIVGRASMKQQNAYSRRTGGR